MRLQLPTQRQQRKLTSLHPTLPPKYPWHDKPHLTPLINFRLGMDLDGNPVFSETKAFPALLESLSSLVIQLCTETTGMFCPEPMAPTNKRNKPTRLSWKVWVSFIDSSLHKCLLPMVISFKAQAQSPLEGQSLNQGARNTGCTRLWQACTALAGCNPSSWKSAGYLRHEGGRWRGRPQDSHLSPGLLSLFKSIPEL